MKITDAGKDLIKRFESCRLKAYLCPAGIWTIGYGHTGPEVYEGLEWTQGQADLAFEADLQAFDAFVCRTCPSATPIQQGALVSLCYNIGMGAFAKSSVARLHNADKDAEAAQAFALWNKAGGKVLTGLVRRRAAEAALYVEGIPMADPHGYQTETAPPATAEGEAPLNKSRALTGQTGAAAATIGTVAAAKLPDLGQMVSDNPDLVGQVLPLISQYWWILALAALGFIAYSMWARIDDRNNGRA